MFFATAIVVGYAHLDYVGIHEWTLESSREGLLCEPEKDPPQAEEEGRVQVGAATWMVAIFCRSGRLPLRVYTKNLMSFNLTGRSCGGHRE